MGGTKIGKPTLLCACDNFPLVRPLCRNALWRRRHWRRKGEISQNGTIEHTIMSHRTVEGKAHTS